MEYLNFLSTIYKLLGIVAIMILGSICWTSKEQILETSGGVIGLFIGGMFLILSLWLFSILCHKRNSLKSDEMDTEEAIDAIGKK